MGPHPRRLALLALVFSLGLVLPAGRAGAGPGPQLVAACRSAGAEEAICRGLYSIERTAATICRDATDARIGCTEIDGTVISPPAVDAHEHSWLARSLAFQRTLDDRRPLQDELWTHTHNSFNADAYRPTFYGIDRNQIYSITDQLRMGIRAIELDAHWAESIRGDPMHGGNAILVCHGNTDELGAGVIHFGCGVNDYTFAEYLAEIRAWADDNPGEVLVLWIENELEGDAYAHELAGRQLEHAFGSLIYRPKRECSDMPMDISRADIRDSGARVLLAGDCDAKGTAWGKYVHVRGDRWIEGGLDHGTDFPAYPCTAERERDRFDRNWIRHWADETGIGEAAQEGGDVTVADALNMTRCGVNMIGVDNLVPFDERLQQLVWSWAPGEPSRHGCAVQGTDGRWLTRSCSSNKRFVCLHGRTWSVTERRGPFADGRRACATEALDTFSAPWNGYENERLRRVHHTEAWLAVRT